MKETSTFGLSAKFNGKRLQQAREINCATRDKLADMLNQLPAYIKLLETTDEQPGPELVEDLAMALAFPTAFFFRPDPPEFINSNSSFWIHYGPLKED